MNDHRNTIHLEEASILEQQAFAGGQRLLRLQAPLCAARAQPGNFAHISCDPLLPMRRPLSILRADAAAGWVEFLYKIVGTGTRLLANRKPGERLSVLGPIGNQFQIDPERPRALLIGGGVGMPPMIFFADRLRHARVPADPLVILGSEVPFPFRARPSQFLVPGIPSQVTAAMPLLEDWQIPSRLASLQGYPGCFQGYVTDLARPWLNELSPDQLAEVEIFACGPEPMLKAIAALARDFGLPCRVSLEEYMACAVGGCAGCVVQVLTDSGPRMQRVCVDGPVFDARRVFSGPPQ